ncbi:hypothetical protein F442_04976, partial [Phytophthora nicotianae P10297]
RISRQASVSDDQRDHRFWRLLPSQRRSLCSCTPSSKRRLLQCSRQKRHARHQQENIARKLHLKARNAPILVCGPCSRNGTCQLATWLTRKMRTICCSMSERSRQ